MMNSQPHNNRDRRAGSLDRPGLPRTDGRTPCQYAEMRALFAALDKDRSGYVDKGELRMTMMEVGFELSEKDLDMMMAAAGVMSRDRIYYEDFVCMMTGKIGQSQKQELENLSSDNHVGSPIPNHHSEPASDIEAMRVSFAMFDRDGDGLISEQEVKDTMTSLGFNVSLAEVKRIVRKVDHNSNGIITFDKFVQAMKRYQRGGSDVSVKKKEEAKLSRENSRKEKRISAVKNTEQEPREVDLITAAFHIFDKDMDGFLNAQDLRVTMQHLGVSVSEQEVYAMMLTVGVGPQGKISLNDFCRIYKNKISESTIERRPSRRNSVRSTKSKQEPEIRAVFSIFDTDHDGYITMGEVCNVLNSMGIHPSQDHITQVFQQVDLDGNGKIDFNEFLLLIKKYERPLPENIEMWEMFNTLDKDRNGIVDPEELKSSFAELGITLTDSDVEVMMKEAKVQGDKIYYDDFVRIMNRQMGALNDQSSDTSIQRKKNPSGENKDRSRRSSGRASSILERKSSAKSRKNSLPPGPSPADGRNSMTSMRSKSSHKSPSPSHASSKGEKTPKSKRGSIKSSTSSTRHVAQCENTPAVVTRLSAENRDVIRPVSGDLERAIYASIQSSAKCEERRERMKTKNNRKSEEVREFFSESIVKKPIGTDTEAPYIDEVEPIKSRTTTNKAPGTWIAFKVFDRDCDGYISKSELHMTMNDLGIDLSEKDLEVMMVEADINKDGRIDYSEFSKLMNGQFESYANQATEVEKQRRHQNGLPNKSNGTSSHSLNPNSLKNPSPSLKHPSPSLKHPSPSLNHPSKHPSPSLNSTSPSTTIITTSSLNPPSYKNSTTFQLTENPDLDPTAFPDELDDLDLDDEAFHSMTTEDSMREAFRAFDINGDGLIDKVELRKTMKRLGESLDEEDVNAMIKVVDRNFDGKVDYEEFLQLMHFSA